MTDSQTFMDTVNLALSHVTHVSVVLSLVALALVMTSSLIRDKFFESDKTGIMQMIPISLTAAGGFVIGYVLAMLWNSPAFVDMKAAWDLPITPTQVGYVGLALVAMWIMSPFSAHSEMGNKKSKDLLATMGGEDDETLAGGAIVSLIGALFVGFCAFAVSYETQEVLDLIVAGDDMRLGAFHAFVFASVLAAIFMVLSAVLVFVLGSILGSGALAIIFSLMVLIYAGLRGFGIL